MQAMQRLTASTDNSIYQQNSAGVIFLKPKKTFNSLCKPHLAAILSLTGPRGGGTGT
ncbi:hypothetical protein ACOBV8_18790 (plasmid) [Pseudoalteromonas espejiana]